MTGADLIPELDHEFAETRKALERVPEKKFDYKPHEKSYSLHALAAHLADIPHWVPVTLDVDVLDLEDHVQVVPKTKAEILARFDEGLAAARTRMERASNKELGDTWTMKYKGEVALAMPKGAVLRSFIFSHNVHHRAQLGVYLRMLGVPVPGHYGPSADEG
jgi:uncharacterized damage-inducible protein DinB